MIKGTLKRLYTRTRALAERYHRARLAIPATTGASQSRPTVYFLAPDTDRPSGGNRTIYQHVDILNATGVAAWAVHQRPGFSFSWFHHETRVTDVAKVVVGPGDLVVVPETDVDLALRMPRGMRHVILNQSGHLTWDRAGNAAREHYTECPDLAGVIVVSQHIERLLEFAFGRVPVWRVRLAIDERLFHPGSGERPRRIAFMPRRGAEDARLVRNLLAARGVLEGWELVALDGLSHREVAAALQTSRMFLSFAHQEGFGLPAAEAMACGNYVVGYHAFGGREFFKPEFCTAIEGGDVLAFARAVEQAIVQDAADPAWCLTRGLKASAFILDEYSRERERASVVEAYGHAIGRAARCDLSVAAEPVRNGDLAQASLIA